MWLKQNGSVPPAGANLENCKYVDHGYFGNSEVYKSEAFPTVLTNIGTGKPTVSWELGIQSGHEGLYVLMNAGVIQWVM